QDDVWYSGSKPPTQQEDAGLWRGPPVCEPSAARHMPQATATADPLLEPPGVRSRFQGLRVTGGSKLAYCVVTVLPRKIAPARRRFSTMGASLRAMLLAQSLEPAAVGQSKTSKMSLMPMGMPCSGPRYFPCCNSSVSRFASARA